MAEEHYILFAVASGDVETTEKSIEELSLLLDTAGGVADDYIIQSLPHPDPATYVGSGKAHELKDLVNAYEADGILCDDELSPTQMHNLSDITDCKVIDRTMLILDIFAAHAKTKEGKIQVEMAQLKHRMSHLRGIGKAMSRLGGGIGTRGPGETKLETDRRAINKKISSLSKEIETMKRVRSTTRKKRTDGSNLTAAIVGYTNAGKSTLLNKMTNADVLAEDKLFATLDPTTRLCTLPDGEEILFTDTVGFISKLPHQLIDAFRSTLEEAKYADIIIHVVDRSDENASFHMDVVYNTLHELGIKEKPVITLFNKSDVASEDMIFFDEHAQKSIRISAKTGDGIDNFFEALEELIHERMEYIDKVIPYSDAAEINRIRKYGHLISEEYVPEGIRIKAYTEKTL